MRERHRYRGAVPTVHLNGTSKEVLIEGYEAAWSALQSAYEAMKQTAPNGRDYYVQSENALSVAISEHMYRLTIVEGLMREYGMIIEAIDQG